MAPLAPSGCHADQVPPGLSVVRVAKLMPGPAGAAVSVPQMVRGSLVSKTRDVNVPVLE